MSKLFGFGFLNFLYTLWFWVIFLLYTCNLSTDKCFKPCRVLWTMDMLFRCSKKYIDSLKLQFRWHNKRSYSHKKVSREKTWSFLCLLVCSLRDIVFRNKIYNMLDLKGNYFSDWKQSQKMKRNLKISQYWKKSLLS